MVEVCIVSGVVASESLEVETELRAWDNRILCSA